MDDQTLLPPADGEVAALLDDWLATAPPPAPSPETPPAAPPVPAARTLLDALREEAMPGLLADPAAHVAAAARRDRYVVFTVADTVYAVRESSVTEVERVPSITPVPRVPGWVRGVTSLRGEVLSVVDLRTFLGLDATSLHSGRVLVVRLTDEELTLGLLVDRVEHIATLPADGVRPPESPLEGPLAPFLSGVAHVSGRTAAVIDLDALLTSADLRQFDDRKPE